jgi:hypothetical protein
VLGKGGIKITDQFLIWVHKTLHGVEVDLGQQAFYLTLIKVRT